MYLFGASGHGKVIAEIAESMGIQIEGFIDIDANKVELLQYNVLHHSPKEVSDVIIAIGNNEVRRRIVSAHVAYNYPILVHPSANVSKRVHLQAGTVIMAGATINVDVIVGKHCIVNTNSSIDHDSIIEDFVHLSPNVALAGNVTVGEGTHVGIGACVIQGIRIGRWCTIGAGAVIIKDVPDGSTVVGNPGKIIKKIER